MTSETMERIRCIEHEAEVLEVEAEQRAEEIIKETECEIAKLRSASEVRLAAYRTQCTDEAEAEALRREEEILKKAETAFAPMASCAEKRMEEVATALFLRMIE